jgi:tRNA A-37 threonylcarbamoyl transferase component Bud32
MVVMEYVDGQPVDEKNGISDAARVSVVKAVRLLHDNGFVHGDIRGPNILIADGEGDEESRVKLLDFDWAGREGEVRYPYRLSQGLWVKGVDDGELILREHIWE